MILDIERMEETPSDDRQVREREREREREERERE
jgi:hypothetical protein